MRHPNKSNNKSNNKQKSSYKGPYQQNPNQEFERVRKYMNPNAEGPTIDTFSQGDSTNYAFNNFENETEQGTNRKRPSKWRLDFITREGFFWFAAVILTGWIGILVYNHSNSLVAIDKDIKYIQEDATEQKATIKEVGAKTIVIDRKVDLLKQQVDLTSK